MNLLIIKQQEASTELACTIRNSVTTRKVGRDIRRFGVIIPMFNG